MTEPAHTTPQVNLEKLKPAPDPLPPSIFTNELLSYAFYPWVAKQYPGAKCIGDVVLAQLAEESPTPDEQAI